MSIAISSPLEVRFTTPTGEEKICHFEHAFYIGRGENCQIWINHQQVSRQHLYCELIAGRWRARDLNSRSGTYANGQPLQQILLNEPVCLSLGRAGPRVYLSAQVATSRPADHLPADQLADLPQTDLPQNQTTDSTSLLRPPMQAAILAPSGAVPVIRPERSASLSIAAAKRAMAVAARKQTVRYRSIFLLLLLMLGAASTVAVHYYYNYYNTRKLGELAVDMFYAMKTLELQVVNLQSALFDNFSDLNPLYGAHIAAQQKRLEALQQEYAEFMAQLNETKMLGSDEDRLILHVARLLGESDAAVPAGFVTEVKRYIHKWQSTQRLSKAIERLRENNYATVIAQALKQHHLPVQFLYLALQESNFRTDAIGPQTRYGHAKGMWQFIPQTAARYGLTIGPQVSEPVIDADDERHDFIKSTYAAARYLRDIYRTDAQASSLLVMASYNWGEGNILRLLEQMPVNPQERNFWQLLQQHAIPQQTYDYVFYIVSAAVIGENPRLFGFDFDNPVKGLE